MKMLSSIAIMVALMFLIPSLVGCGSSSPVPANTGTSGASKLPRAASPSPTPTTLVGTWRGPKSSVLVVHRSGSGYDAVLYWGGHATLAAHLRQHAGSLVGTGRYVKRWKLRLGANLSRLVLRDSTRGVVFFTRASSSTASPAAN